MTEMITIVGLGQIGASMGLALGNSQKNLHRIGHDKSISIAKTAQKMGAVDEVKINLPASVRKSKIVLLCLPLNEIHSTLEVIAPDLPEECVVMATSPLQAPVIDWAKEILPEGRFYVGLVPSISSNYLHRIELGLEAAKEDLFKKSVIIPLPSQDAPEEVVKLAIDFIELVGAEHLFADLFETDGVMTSSHILPQLIAVAMLNAFVDQPGWKETRQLAGRPFAALSSALAYQDEFDALADAALLHRESVAHGLDVIIGSLQGLRNDIADNKQEDVIYRIKSAVEGHHRWFAGRLKGNWSNVENSYQGMLEIPSYWERLVGIRKRSQKGK